MKKNQFELFEIYKDNNERLRPDFKIFLNKKNKTPLQKNLDILMKFVYNEIKDFKSNCEDGWELFEENDFNPIMNIQRGDFYIFVKQIFGNIMESYRDKNLLDFFLKYYSNYFFLTLQPEFFVNMTAYVKMILYAYTLKEGDPNKNFYCIMNDDLRSKNPYKISRYINIIRLIGGLVKEKRLKSFNGNLYRASFLKDELIKRIKIGFS